MKGPKFLTGAPLLPEVNAESTYWPTIILVNSFTDHELESLTIKLHVIMSVRFSHFFSRSFIASISEDLPRSLHICLLIALFTK